ncbi:FCPA, partial [Symbiodinium sp. KB8]
GRDQERTRGHACHHWLYCSRVLPTARLLQPLRRPQVRGHPQRGPGPLQDARGGLGADRLLHRLPRALRHE